MGLHLVAEGRELADQGRQHGTHRVPGVGTGGPLGLLAARREGLGPDRGAGRAGSMATADAR